MSNIVKICSIHGSLDQKDIKIRKKLNNKSKIQYRCNICHLHSGRVSYQQKRLREGYELKGKLIEKLRLPKRIKISRKDQMRKIKLMYKYRISIEQYNEMAINQNNLCRICKKQEQGKAPSGKFRDLAVDHCHKTNKIRGLLCGKCNRMLGYAKDSIEILQSAIEYLKAST